VPGKPAFGRCLRLPCAGGSLSARHAAADQSHSWALAKAAVITSRQVLACHALADPRAGSDC
jgi:hypothetical protein